MHTTKLAVGALLCNLSAVASTAKNGSMRFLQPRTFSKEMNSTAHLRAAGGFAHTWYRICEDDGCNTPVDKGDSVPTDAVGNNCDTMMWTTLYGFSWADGIRIAKINLQTDDPTQTVTFEFFADDYCTGPFNKRVAKYNPGFSNQVWDDAWQGGFDFQVKSIRTYVDQPNFQPLPGIGIKLIVFPRYDMYPYDEFSCEPDSCNDLNDNCDVLQGAQSAEHGLGDADACASSDDWIFCIPPGQTAGPVSMTWPGLDFADANEGYVNKFLDYPIGSIFFGVYYSNWDGYTGPSTYCDATAADPCQNADYKNCQVAVRFWKGDSWPSEKKGGQAPGWDELSEGLLEYKLPLWSVCDHGGFQNLNIMQWFPGPDWQDGADYGDAWPGWMSWVQVGIQEC